MTDAVAVWPPGYRLTDSETGAPIIGATIQFFDAQTTNPKTVYADRDLSVELGTSVVTDSLGCPTSNGTAKTDVFVGPADYKVVIKNANGVVIETKDNRPGATVSASSVDVAVTAIFPVVTKSLNYTVLPEDQNTTFLVNCSSGNVTLTLPSATDVANGWKIKVQHAGSANQAIIVRKSGSGQSINEGTKTYGGASFALALNGEDCEITSDGGNWRVSAHTTPFIKNSQGVIPIVDRLATSPGSPAAGSAYLLTGNGGSWSTFTTGDIALYTGAGWLNITPYTDCGWLVFVQDENLYYEFQDSAWVSQNATTGRAGRVKVANQTSQEAATANDTAVTPGTQQWHPSAVSVWGKASVSGGNPSLVASFNMTSITDSGVGDLTATIATDFSSNAWACAALLTNASGSNIQFAGIVSGGQSAGAVELACTTRQDADGLSDPGAWHWSGLGDQ